jgi:site-specific recombinase XerD
MIDAMLVRGFAVRTQRSYLDAVLQLVKHYRCSPDQLTTAQLQAYFLYLVKERQLSPATRRLYLNGIRFFYLQVLGWSDVELTLNTPKRKQRIPELLSRDEVARLLAAVANRKHRMMLTTCYGCGLRVSEPMALRVSDIDGERRLLRVTRGKGGKDRQVLLGESLLHLFARWGRDDDYRPGLGAQEGVVANPAKGCGRARPGIGLWRKIALQCPSQNDTGSLYMVLSALKPCIRTPVHCLAAATLPARLIQSPIYKSR